MVSPYESHTASQMSKLRVAIAGATGYAGEELIRILQKHPFVELTHLAASAKWDRSTPVEEVFPQFAHQLQLPIESLDPGRLSKSCDVAFLALPHGLSMDVVPTLLKDGRRVIDLAGDFRLKDPALFSQWYGLPHRHPELLSQAVYGISELYAEPIRKALLVANPGCYATSVILACVPLLQAGILEPTEIIVDAKSGLTGAGRKMDSAMMFAQMNENLWAYKVNNHPHAPEIEQALRGFSVTSELSLCFVPHVVPLNRGIFSTIYLRLKKPHTWDDIAAIYRAFYGQAPFIRIRPEAKWPKVREVSGTNYCDIAFTLDLQSRRLIIGSVIDNLVKGAAGQAVQNLNLMAGFPETTGLL